MARYARTASRGGQLVVYGDQRIDLPSRKEAHGLKRLADIPPIRGLAPSPMIPATAIGHLSVNQHFRIQNTVSQYRDGDIVQFDGCCEASRRRRVRGTRERRVPALCPKKPVDSSCALSIRGTTAAALAISRIFTVDETARFSDRDTGMWSTSDQSWGLNEYPRHSTALEATPIGHDRLRMKCER